MSVTMTVTDPPRITSENVATLFPDVDTSLAHEVLPAQGSSVRGSNELEGYNEEQVRLMDEVCIVLDEDDKPIGSANKKTCECISTTRVASRECAGQGSMIEVWLESR